MLLAEAAEAHIGGPDQHAWLCRLDVERRQLYAAFEVAELEDLDPSLGLRMGIALTPFWRVRGHLVEGRDWLDRALAAAPGGVPRLRAKAMSSLGLLEHLLGEPNRATALAEESLEISSAEGSDLGCARALLLLGYITASCGDRRLALPIMNEGLSLARRSGEHSCLVDGLLWSAEALLRGDDVDTAHARFEECFTRARAAGDQRALGEALIGLGEVALSNADFADARRLLEEARPLTAGLGDRLATARALLLLGAATPRPADGGAVTALFAESVSIALQVGASPLVARCLSSLGRHLAAQGRDEESRALLREAVLLARRTHCGHVLVRAAVFLAPLLAGQGERDDAADLIREALSVAQASADEEGEAWASFALGQHARQDGDAIRAGVMHQRSLGARVNLDPAAVAESLETLAALAAARRPQRAARLLGAAERLRKRAPAAESSAMCPCAPREAEALRRRLVRDGFQAALEQGASLSPEDAVAYAARGTGAKALQRGGGGWDDLTSTEREVAQLAAKGLSNPQIADKLLMSRRTVRAHLEHVFAKLGISARSELAASAEPADRQPPDRRPRRDPGHRPCVSDYS